MAMPLMLAALMWPKEFTHPLKNGAWFLFHQVLLFVSTSFKQCTQIALILATPTLSSAIMQCKVLSATLTSSYNFTRESQDIATLTSQQTLTPPWG